MKKSVVLWLALVLALTLTFTGCAISMNTVLVTVNDRQVTMKEYCAYYQNFLNQYDEGNAAYWDTGDHKEELEAVRQAALISVKQVAMLEQIIAEEGIELTEDDKAYLDEFWTLKCKSGGGEEKFIKTLKENCLNKELFLKNQAFTMLLNRYVLKYHRDEIEKDYFCAKHILITFESHDNDEEACLALAKDIKAQLDAGADFDALIEKYGEDPGMAYQPDGYYFTYGTMVAPFEKATIALKYGEISEPVASSYGYHIILRLPLDEQYLVNNLVNIVDGSFFTEPYQLASERLETANIKNNYTAFARIKPSTVRFSD